MVEETSAATADRGRFLSDPGLQQYLGAKHWTTRIADKDTRDANGKTPADLKPYFERAAGKSLPRMYLVDDQGVLRIEGAVPSTPAELLDLLRKVGG